MTAREMQIPITTLSWNIDRLTRILGERANERDTARILSRLRDANERLVTLVEDLLNLAQLHEGSFTMAPRMIQIPETVRRAVRQAEEEARQQGITLRWRASSQDIPLTMADPERMHQVLVNLLNNAIKYTPRGGSVTVTTRTTNEIAPATVMSAQHSASSDTYILCEVKDTGIGIPEDEKAGIFQQFFRGRKAVASDRGGTGLGLYLVKTIVEQHQGAIWFTSREGFGSAFSFTIPVISPYNDKQKTTRRSRR